MHMEPNKLKNIAASNKVIQWQFPMESRKGVAVCGSEIANPTKNTGFQVLLMFPG